MIDTWQPFIPLRQIDGLLNPFYRAAVRNRLPLALWRFPRQTVMRGVVDLSGDHHVDQVDCQTMSPGFVMAPFQQDDLNRPYFLRANLYLNTAMPAIRENLALNHNATVSANRKKFEAVYRESIRHNGIHPAGQKDWYLPAAHDAQQRVIDKIAYCDWIEQAVRAICNRELTKVVLSRSMNMPLPRDFHVLRHFCQLCNDYPNAFVSLVAIPGAGTWIGATPELFLHVNSRTMTTVSLAGTQMLSERSKPQQWGNKEIDEQEIVSDYIRNCFAEHDIHDFYEHPLETVQIGDLCHLQTKFSYDFAAPEDKQIVNHFLLSMHPTPAVCGVAKGKALQFIKTHESHQRKFYSGYLGPVNLEHESNFYVNIRCMQLQKNTTTLYAGGGITLDSIPENEWQETELKLHALLKYLRPDTSGSMAKHEIMPHDRF
jgi:isochorismate synthase